MTSEHAGEVLANSQLAYRAHVLELLKELEAAISESIVGKPIYNETLDIAHDLILEELERRFPNNPGLHAYLDGIKFVVEDGQE